MIRIPTLVAAVTLALVATGEVRADLTKARAERNLGRRARMALDNANAQFEIASKGYINAGWGETKAALDEVLESVELALTSLDQTGKKPRNSRDYKNLEIKTNALLKRLGDFFERVSFNEREQVNGIKERIQKIHDDTLMAVMGEQKAKKKK